MSLDQAPPLEVTLPRCCPSHRDWPTLAQHLLGDFPEAHIADVIRELRRARNGAEAVKLGSPEEELEMAELIARHNLLLLTGGRPDAARLDPERHTRGPVTTG